MNWPNAEVIEMVIEDGVANSDSSKEIIDRLDEMLGKDNYNLHEAIGAIKKEREFREKINSR